MLDLARAQGHAKLLELLQILDCVLADLLAYRVQVDVVVGVYRRCWLEYVAATGFLGESWTAADFMTLRDAAVGMHYPRVEGETVH